MQSTVTAGVKDIPPDMMYAIEADDSLFCVAQFLEDACLLAFMITSAVLRLRLIGNDDFWNLRLAGFAALYPGLAHLDRGESKTAFHWYGRWRLALASSESMALDHHANRWPYMRLFGSFDGSTYVVHTPLRLPVTHGLIAEVMTYVKRLGKPHAAKDAADMFVNAPPNAERQFQNIEARVILVRREGVNRPDKMAKLVTTLEQIYTPTSYGTVVASPATAGSSEVHALEVALAAEQAHSQARERTLRTVRLRLTRTQQELARAYAYIAELELEGLELRVENGELRAENRELRAKNRELKGEVRRLDREMDDRPPKEKLIAARAQLAEARRNASAAAKKTRPIYLERARLVKQLSAAEERYREAEAWAEEDLASIKGDEQLTQDLMNLREAQLEAEKTAQVAAAHHETS